MNLHNRSRFYCQQRIADLNLVSHNWTQRVSRHFFWLLLTEIEHFTETDFEDNSEAETLAYFALISDTAKDKLSDWVMVWFKDIIQQGVSVKAISEIILTARQDFLTFLKNYTLPEYDAPILPYRRVLSDAEYEEIWAKFESLWIKPSKNIYFLDRFPGKAIANKLQEIGIKRLLNLGLAISYEVDITLMEEMFSYDDSYWTCYTLDWYILAEGHGYPKFAGRAIEKIIATIPWCTNKI